jgi:hypothetical protein
MKLDLFEKRVEEWIMNEEGEKKFYAGEKTVYTDRVVLERILSNVITAYRDLIRFPDRCPNCTRSGRDHDGECETPDWEGKDNGIFEEI